MTQAAGPSVLEKWSPSSVNDLIGQDCFKSWLAAQLRRGAPFKSAVFAGPTGVGKTTAARFYGQAVLCSSQDANKPCGTCDDCRAWSAPGGHDGYREISGPEHRKVAAASELADVIRRGLPWQDRYFIFIDEADALTRLAFKYLLKPTEIARRPTTIVFATTELGSIPKPVLDRVDLVAFRRIDFTTAFSSLHSICQKFSIDVDPEALARIVDLAAGSQRAAVKRVVQAASTHGKIDHAAVNDLIELQPVQAVVQLVKAMLHADTQTTSRELQLLSDPASEIAEDIQRILLFVFKTRARRQHFIDARFGTIAKDSVDEIADLISTIAVRLRLNEDTVWRDVIAFWDPTPATTKTSLLAKADKFCASLESRCG